MQIDMMVGAVMHFETQRGELEVDSLADRKPVSHVMTTGDDQCDAS